MICKQFVIILSICVTLIHSYHNSNYGNCRRFENKIYHFTITLPGKEPFYTLIEFLPNGVTDQIYSIAGGDNRAELGSNITLSNRFGNYRCYPNNYLRFRGVGYMYKTSEVSYLADNGGMVLHDYYLRFNKDSKTCNGLVKYSVYRNDADPFSTSTDPVYESDVGKVYGCLLEFRAYYAFSGL